MTVPTKLTPSELSPLRKSLYAACRDFLAKHGAVARRELLEKVAGVSAPSEVPDEKISAVLDAMKNTKPPRPAGRNFAEAHASLSKDAFARFNNPKRTEAKS